MVGRGPQVGRKTILFSIMFYGIIEILAKNTLEGGPRPKKSENRGSRPGYILVFHNKCDSHNTLLNNGLSLNVNKYWFIYLFIFVFGLYQFFRHGLVILYIL